MYFVSGVSAGALLASAILLMSGNPISAVMPLFLCGMIGAWLGNARAAPAQLLPRSSER